jgi:BlaI family penicillinase repressor
MPIKPIELTEAEWTVIKAIWDNEPCTAPQIQQELHGQTRWTYSTVRTFMDRMVGKNLLASEKAKGVTVYRSLVTRKQAQSSELLYALKQAFNGALTPMVQCLLDSRRVSPSELEAIESLIKAKKKGTRK